MNQIKFYYKMGWLYSTSLFYLNGLVFILILLSPSLYAQKRDSIQKPIKYHISVIEGVSKSRINQAFKNTITLNRLITRALDENDNRLSLFLQILIPSIGIGISHEEGHRSVLTELNIGSISQPFSFDKGLLYVKGVSDETLINLRRNNLPDYVHLHTAGLESDYMSILELENFITFEFDDLNHLKYDYFTRKISHLFYFLTTITPFLFSDFEEEQNELERDIVGHDILGAIRHLHRPTENFYRYTFFDDLTNDEKKYARKTVLYSLLNLINPMLFGKKHFTLSTNSTINFSLGYSLAPFGGHFDQNFWIKKEKLNLFLYTRQFHNKEDWFFGTGFRILNYPINQSLSFDVGFHYWNQPNDMLFQSSENFSGIGGELDFSYKLFSVNKNRNDIYLVSGIRWKGKGFLPGYSSLKEKAQINTGFKFSW